MGYFHKSRFGAGSMAMVRLVKALAAKPDDLSLIPGIHVVEELTSQTLSSGFCMHALVCVCTTTQTNK